MYPVALHKSPNQTSLMKSLAQMYTSKATAKNQESYEKNWDRNTIEDLEQVCPKQDYNLLSKF